MEIQHGFMEIENTKDTVIACADEICTRLIFPQEKCFIDVQSDGMVYCSLCGPCVRYHRKKEAHRQETKGGAI